MNSFYRSFLFKTMLLLLPIMQLPHMLQGQVCIADFLDGVFRSQMKEHNIAGLTFSLYSADTLELKRSWGYSHVETLRRADENTGFMIGSISKLFVWVSAMQLVEQGKLDLNKPVNDYLSGFRLPESYKPVTMKHIMTHTSGFEDHYHLFSKRFDYLPELETYLTENLPQQIYEPGTTPASSNYATTLAAYVIEQITNTGFNDYVEQNIFEPLGMHNTTFRQPASFAISDAKSRGYNFNEGRFTSPFEEYVLPAPAGAAVSTAADMVKFMSALLKCDENTLENILTNETIAQMLGLLDQPHPQSGGMAHGFMRMDYHGKEVFWHGGDTYFFHSAFLLVPALKTGIFISMNTAGSGFDYLDQSLLILDFLNGKKREITVNKRVNGMYHFTGTYKMSRRVESSYQKVFSNFMTARISAGTEGLLFYAPGEDAELFRPYDEDVFISDYKKLIFERNENGSIKRFMLSHLPIMVFEKISFRENAIYNLILLAIVLLIAIKNIITPTLRVFKRDKRIRQIYRWPLLLSGVLIYLFFILFLTTFSGVESVIFEKPTGLRLIMIIPLASMILFLIAIIFWIQSGVWSKQPLPATFWQFAGFLIMVIFYLQMHYWNFFNFMV